MYAMFDVAKKCWSKVRRSSMCGVMFDAAKNNNKNRSKIRRNIMHNVLFDVAKK